MIFLAKLETFLLWSHCSNKNRFESGDGVIEACNCAILAKRILI